MREEVWLSVQGFEGLYEVSSLGRVRRSANRTSNGRNWPCRVLKERFDRYGYVKYTLYRQGRPSYLTGHRLVCRAFHGPPPGEADNALHRDDNKRNNRPENLYWGSLSDNQKDIIRNGNNYGLNKVQCVNGHNFTESNTYRNPKTGLRSCKTCRYEHTKKAQQRRRKHEFQQSA